MRHPSLKPREEQPIPPEKLLEILAKILPEDMVLDTYENLMKEENDG